MKKTKKVFLILIAVTAILTFTFLRGFFPFSIEESQVGAATCQIHDISGWAWSENTGWISFECGNCDSDHNGTTDDFKYAQCPTGMTVGDYGVDFDGDGLLSGYAWSERVGWVTFNQGDLSVCPSAPCEAVVNTTTGDVSGWAKALNNGDGWDGWISLDGQTQGYQHKRYISTNPSQVGSTEPDFPVLVEVAGGSAIGNDLASECLESGYDIKFMNNAEDTQLDHEIEYWDSSTGELVAWVRLSALDSSVPTTFYMYYGNPGETVNQSNPSGVWDSNYLAVYHLNGSDWRRTLDSTGNGYNATGTRGNPSYWQDGQIGPAVYFDGVGDTIIFDQIFTNETAFTLEAWAKPLIPPDARYIASQWHVGGGTKEGAFIQVWPDVPNYHGWINETTTASVSYTNNVWTQIVLTLDGLDNRIYKNGGEEFNQKTLEAGVTWWDDKPFHISDCSWGPGWRVFNGYIDEVRLSKMARDGDWIQTSYNTMDSSTFISIGSKTNITGYTPLDYGVKLEINELDPDYQEFYDWAWGGGVIGWISFNCIDYSGDCGAGSVDYYATTSLEPPVPLNTDPVAVFSCDESPCEGSEACVGYDTCGLIMVNSSYDVDSGDSITASTWYIDTIERDSCVGLCNFVPVNYGLTTPNPESYIDYRIDLTVEDENGGTHTTSTLPYYYRHERDAISDFECSIDDNPDWDSKDWSTECENFNVPPGTIVYFKDDLGASYNKSYPSCCGEHTITSRKWFKDGALFRTDSSEASTTVNLFPAVIKLEITDSDNRDAFRSREVYGESDIPRWREVSP